MIRKRHPLHPHVSRLLEGLAAHNTATYGSAGLEGSPADQWDAAFVGYAEGHPVALLGVCPRNGAAHMIRLYVDPAHRGHGWARHLAERGLDWARRAGYERAVWDTGSEAASVVQLGSSLGGVRTEAFGEHAGSPSLECFELDLRDGQTAVPVGAHDYDVSH